MTSERNWLNDIIIVNENNTNAEVGDLSIFRSLGDACRKIEPWYANEVTYFALNGMGYPVKFFADGNLTKATIQQEELQDLPTLNGWLRSSAQSIFSARQFNAKRNKLILGELESKGTLPTSIEGLIAYHDFTK